MTSKFALVIANTEYQDASFAKLTAPGKDAEEFAQILKAPELAAFDDVQVLLNEGEGKTRRSIARFFAERKPADLLLLYFSGHGVRNEQGQLFLAANDTEISILEATGIPAEFITRAMNNSRSQRQLLILDCCNSGSFAHGSKSAAGVGKSMGIATAFEGDGFGRVVLTATDATQYAWEGDKVIGDTQKSVFTHFLIEGLKGDADRNGDGRIHVDELYDYAYEQVVRRTPKQTPGKWSYRQQGDLILRENLKPRDVKPVPLPSDLLELLSYPNFSARKAGIQELIILLDGKHLGMARAAADKLREIAENDASLDLRKTASDTLIAHGIPLRQDIETPKESLSAVKPLPVEVPKEEHKEEKKIEKPTRITTSSLGEVRVRQRTPRTFPDWRGIASNSNFRLLGSLAGGLLIISLLLWGGLKFLQNLPAVTPEPTGAFQINMTFTSQPSITTTPQPERTTVPSSTPTLGIGSTMTGKGGMTLVYVPAGEFAMGAESGETNEIPAHSVTLDGYWIDQTEITVRMYALCVEAGVCEEPNNEGSMIHSSYYGNAEFDNYPVINVDWNMAKTYCVWVDRRLPTEAEWEKAARGPDARTYPWGNTFNGTFANSCDTSCLTIISSGGDDSFDDGFAHTAPVGSYPSGASIYGALDMAGNVFEWVADWYEEGYYFGSPSSNPLGPDSGQERVMRGGSWLSDSYFIISSRRSGDDPSIASDTVGFRCAMNATP